MITLLPTSRWLSAARADGGGLLIPGYPSSHAAGLLLSSGSIETVAGTATATLDWTNCVSVPSPRTSQVDRWSIEQWSHGRGGPIGVALSANGVCAAAIEPVRLGTMTMRNRLNRLFQPGTVVPLCAVGAISPQVSAQRQMMTALTSYLAARPDVRAGLDDQRRVRALIRDMAQSKLKARELNLGFRRVTIEVISALNSLGYQFPLAGRPLPDDQRPTADEVVSRLMDHLARSRYAQDIHPDEAQVRAIATREYLNVKPWPFQALTNTPP